MSDPFVRGADSLLQGRFTRLRAIDPRDYEYLRRQESNEPDLTLYRQRGITLSPEQYVQSLWRGVQSQFLICDVQSGSPLGVVALYSTDFRHGHGRIGGMLFGEHRRSGWPLEGFLLFIDYVFRVFGLRKLYGDVMEFNAAPLSFLMRSPFEVEGCFRNHEFYDGRYWDQVVVGLTSQAWATARDKYLGIGSVSRSPLQSTNGPAAAVIGGLLESAGYEGEIRESDRLVEDLGFDSLTMLETLLALEVAADFSLSLDLLDSVRTIGDLRALLEGYLRPT